MAENPSFDFNQINSDVSKMYQLFAELDRDFKLKSKEMGKTFSSDVIGVMSLGLSKYATTERKIFENILKEKDKLQKVVSKLYDEELLQLEKTGDQKIIEKKIEEGILKLKEIEITYEKQLESARLNALKSEDDKLSKIKVIGDLKKKIDTNLEKVQIAANEHLKSAERNKYESIVRNNKKELADYTRAEGEKLRLIRKTTGSSADEQQKAHQRINSLKKKMIEEERAEYKKVERIEGKGGIVGMGGNLLVGFSKQLMGLLPGLTAISSLGAILTAIFLKQDMIRTKSAITAMNLISTGVRTTLSKTGEVKFGTRGEYVSIDVATKLSESIQKALSTIDPAMTFEKAVEFTSKLAAAPKLFMGSSESIAKSFAKSSQIFKTMGLDTDDVINLVTSNMNNMNMTMEETNKMGAVGSRIHKITGRNTKDITNLLLSSSEAFRKLGGTGYNAAIEIGLAFANTAKNVKLSQTEMVSYQASFAQSMSNMSTTQAAGVMMFTESLDKMPNLGEMVEYWDKPLEGVQKYFDKIAGSMGEVSEGELWPVLAAMKDIFPGADTLQGAKVWMDMLRNPDKKYLEMTTDQLTKAFNEEMKKQGKEVKKDPLTLLTDEMKTMQIEGQKLIKSTTSAVETLNAKLTVSLEEIAKVLPDFSKIVIDNLPGLVIVIGNLVDALSFKDLKTKIGDIQDIMFDRHKIISQSLPSRNVQLNEDHYTINR